MTGEKKEKRINEQQLIQDHIDIRLFGLLFAVENVHFKKVGSVQFAIGQSLNKVTELPIRMTRVVPTEADKKAGTFGEKSILRYSFIVFHGFLNNFAADEVQLSENDVTEMIKGAWHGTNELSTTSKYGQVSRLLIRIKYKKPTSYVGDIDRYIHLEPTNDKVDLDRLDDVSQVILNIDQLLSILKNNKDEIESLEYIASDDLVAKYGDKKDSIQTILEGWSQENTIIVTNLKETLES
jgi:CRISPR-associated protein Csh2